jgi:ribosomal protection tetracycline resistance protein
LSTLNLGIVAHVDAGKTSLTEHLLYAAGAIERRGSVDHGSTQTDSLALERRRGITIKSAVVSFALGGVTVNLIDTPGHPDFIAEVERVLSVLDGAVLVISAVEGVQAQTRVLLRALRRLGIPTLIFVNKIDRGGAGYARVLRSIAAKLAPGIVAMGSVSGLGTRGAAVHPFGAGDTGFTDRLVDLVADHDDAFLAAYVRDESAASYRQLRGSLAELTGKALTHPVFFGSAITGAGVDTLMAGIAELLPAASGDATAPPSGTVFKVERGPAGEKVAYVRMFSGTVHVRDRLSLHGKESRVTAVSVFDRGSAERRASVSAGHIGRLWGLAGVRIGDVIGTAPERLPDRQFAPPTLETVVVPSRSADRGALHTALAQLAEQDPLINVRLDEIRQEISVSLYGEVQKEVIQATLADDFGVDVTFSETTTICLERPRGTGEAFELIGKEPNPFLATVGLRVEPAPMGSGVEFRLGVELGSMPYAFFRAVEETVTETLSQGLHGWHVTDCVITMTHSGYWARQSHAHGTFDKSMSSTAGDFRNLTPLVLMAALRQAGTHVYEPMHHFRLDIPADTVSAIHPTLTRLRAIPQSSTQDNSTYRLEGHLPAAHVHELHQLLPALTRGEGILESAFDHYAEIRGATPTRPRTDHNPLNRKEYLLHVVRRV